MDPFPREIMQLILRKDPSARIRQTLREVCKAWYSVFEVGLMWEEFDFGVVFNKTCESNSIEACKFLIRVFDAKKGRWFRRAFLIAIERGFLDMAQWLFVSINCRVDINAAFRLACLSGQMEVAKWISSIAEVSPRRGTIYDICETGNLDFIKWYATKFNITPPIVADTNARSALLRACSDGHLDVAKWLVENGCAGCLTGCGFILEDSYNKGHADVVKWIIEEQNSTDEISEYGITEVMKCAARRGDLDMIKYLTTFTFTIPKYLVPDFIRHAYDNKHYWTARWLFIYFEVDEKEIRLLPPDYKIWLCLS